MAFHQLYFKIREHERFGKFDLHPKVIEKFRDVSKNFKVKDMYDELGDVTNENGFSLGQTL